MELFASDTHYILVDGEESLWFDRQSGSYDTKTGSDRFNDPGGSICLGTVYGFIGKLQISHSSETRLVFIRQHALVGTLKGCPVYKILSVVSIPLESESELLLEPCCNSSEHRGSEASHNDGSGPTSPSHQVTVSDGVAVSRHPQLFKVKTPPIRSFGPKKLEKQDKVERRILDEFHKMFTEADSFFYSPEYDITNSIQRQNVSSCDEDPGKKKTETKRKELALWERADPRFFWNWHMVQSLISVKSKKTNRWILPIIQGFIQSETCHMEPLYDAVGIPDIPVRGSIDLWVISRRSRYQAGTRYLRRGVDELGKVANYVETEQIMIFKSHMISFVQIRGSIPVFWSQPNRYRYRPPPRLERDDEENYNAFRKHFEEETSVYERLIIVNLVEKSGKEKVLGDAYLENVMRHNSSLLTYVTFDFHESCRGMKFENVSVLVSKMSNIIKAMSYCWIDSYGTVLQQTSTFRVNCVDCLDRTNVVQTHLAREMLNIQLSKLGLIVPEVGLPGNVKTMLQTIWANNGDTISKQYAGTNALKGDFTRTGERKITGVMKDGMNSANRYYLNRFKDASRQAVIDLMLGVRNTVTEADLTEEKQPEEKENLLEQIKMVIEDVKRCAIPPDEIILGAWGLVNAKLNEPDTIDIDAIFILTEKNYYVTEYDCTMDSMTDTQTVNLSTVESLELGFDTLMQPTTFWNIFHPGNNSNQTLVPNLRINYVHEGELLSHDFRSSNIRFFNNVPVPIQQPEEMQEALRMLAETIKISVEAQGKEIAILLTNSVPPKDQPKTRLPVMASSWMHRYFTAQPPESGTGNGVEDTVPLAKKITNASLERFTPKYFRRGSAAAQTNKQQNPPAPTSRTMIISASQNEPEHVDADQVILKTSDLCKAQLHLATNQRFYPDLIDFNVRTPVEGGQPSRSLILPVDDLVLASCGIISIPQFRRMATSPIYASDLIINEDFKSEAGISPVTPMSEVTISFPMPSNIISKPLSLQRHRCSLPTNMLDPDLITESMKRSKTPEITITEEPLAQYADVIAMAEKSQLKNQIRPGICRRISRSSEEVNKISSSPYGIQILGTVPSAHSSKGSKLLSLFPLTKNENRATSQQDLVDSLGHEMRGSHSDNALRENPFLNQVTQKRDLVFAPLGKLARGMQNLGASYLDPRKLRDSFKPVVKKDAAEDILLEERKRQCQTLIIDV